MRKHFYLVTDHENDDLVGTCKITEQRYTHPLKNEEGDITVLDEGSEGFEDIGRMVGMGYADFEDEDDYEVRVADVIQQKLGEIDAEHLEKAGLDPQEVGT